MKKTILMIAMLCVACGGQKSTEKSDAVSPRVLQAAKIADAIQANPDGAAAILAENGMTEQEFTDLMLEIAADEKMSADYAAARKR